MAGETLRDLLIIRDELIDLVEDPSVGASEKDDFLTEAAIHPEYGQVIEMHSYLQLIADGLARRINPSLYPSPQDTDWIDNIIGDRYGHEGTFDQLTDLNDVIYTSLPNSIVNRASASVQSRRLTSRLIHASHKAMLKAESYRRFNVGCRGFYIDEEGGRVGIYSSYNVKRHTLQPKICAEGQNLAKALQDGFTYCVSLTVMSLECQPDPATGIKSKIATQIPCEPCRDNLSTHPLTDQDTLIICASADGKVLEYRLEELLSEFGCSL